jgi:hypothetical protein
MKPCEAMLNSAGGICEPLREAPADRAARFLTLEFLSLLEI